VASLLKRLLVGRPLASSESEEQRISKTIGLAVFSSDAISSTAYATEEILFVIAVGASSLALGIDRLLPIAGAVAVLLAVVVASYRRTIFAYPQGGGSYIISRENLGQMPSLVAGASILVDYILTVAVSVSAGVAALISIPSLNGLADQRVTIGLVLVVLLTVANLRGIKESGQAFAIPTYVYIVMLGALIAYGLFQTMFGDLGRIEVNPEEFEGERLVGGELAVLVLLKGFSSGAVALTGIEAIAVGVPAFRKPEAKNAAATLMWMAVILGTLFFGTAALAHQLHPYPSHHETVFSQMGHAVFGGGPLYLTLQIATAGILVLAANTAYAAFPRLCSMLSEDGYLPHQFASRGDRLVFSNGILVLSAAAAGMIVAFGGKTNALIPLYAVGVFTCFTLSQTGIVRYQLRKKIPGWRSGAVISSVGAFVTLAILLIVAVTKFSSGAFIPIIVLPVIIALFLSIRRHYDRVNRALKVTPEEVRPERLNHTIVVLVGKVRRGELKALAYAESLRPNHIAAVHVAYENDDTSAIEAQWQEFKIQTPLEIVHSPYRELVEILEEYLDELDDRWGDDTITVVIPEFVVNHWYEQALHNQSALAIKLSLLFRPRTVVTSVPYHLGTEEPAKDPAKDSA
jgi:amino acid transporter